MKRLIKNTLTIIVLSLFLFSCQEDLEIGDAGSVTLSGDWVVIEYSLDMEALYGPSTLQIYNTSFDEDKIWVDNIYDSGIKVKSNKLSETTFSVSEAEDVNGAWGGTINISEAQVINEDSIIFRVTLYTSAGEVYDDYYEAGHRYTGWPEDQH
jgi:hypothetical protein